MAQVLEFRLPDLGEGLTEATIVRWLVEVGDVVAVDQTVVEVETAKAMVDVPCPYGGVVTARFGEEGAELPVGEPLLTVAVGAAASGDGDEGSGNVLVGYGTAAPPARRGRVRPSSVTGAPASRAPGAPTGTRTGVSADAGSVVAAPNGGRELGRAGDGPAARAGDGDHLVADGRHGPGRVADDRPGDGGRGGVAVIADGPVPVMSPLVRRLARENGVDLRELEGSGPDGLILRADVEYALRAAATGQVRAPAAAEPSGPRPSATGPSRPSAHPWPSPPISPRPRLALPRTAPVSLCEASAAQSPTSSPAAVGR